MIYSDNCFTIQVIDWPTINTILIIIQKDFGSKNILMNLEVALKHLKKFRQHFADLNDLNTLVINAHFLGMSLCLVVIGVTLAQEAVSLNPGTGNWMDNFLHLFVVKISLLFESPKVTKIGP